MGRNYEHDYDGVLDWIVDGEWESIQQSDEFASVVDKIDVPSSAPDDHFADTVSAYDAFIEAAEAALDKHLGEDLAADVVTGESLHGAVVEVWHTLEEAGVGVWDGDWEREYGVDGDLLADRLRSDKKLNAAYQRLRSEVDNEVYEKMRQLADEHLGEQSKQRRTRSGRMRALNRKVQRAANRFKHIGGGCFISSESEFPCDDDFEDLETGETINVQTTYDEHFQYAGDVVTKLPREPYKSRRKKNAAKSTKWCIVRAVFTDTNDYGFVTWHVIPWNGSWEGLDSRSSHAEGVAEEFGTMASEAHDDVGWAKWALESPWDSGAIEHAGDGHYYNSIYPSMDWDSFQHEVPDNWDQMEPDEQQAWAEQYDNDHGSLSVHLQIEVIGCYSDPNDAFKSIWHDHNFGIGGKAKLWNYDYDDKGGYYLDESIDPYDVAQGAVEIEFESGESSRKRKMRKLNKAETRRLKNRLMKG